MWRLVVVIAGALLCLSCGADDPIAPRLVGEELLADLNGPTQITVGPDGDWWIAVLGGSENEGAGQILRVDPDRPDEPPIVVIDQLDKPTGVAIFGSLGTEELWVMERDRLTRGPLDGSSRTVVVDNLPTNGRSEGSLTVDNARLLYDTSGRLADGDGTDGKGVAGVVVDGSGTLWAVNRNGEITVVAEGFKHAYAQTRSVDGRLFTTEINDGRYDGKAPNDELIVVDEGQHHGWPRCAPIDGEDNVPIAEYGGDLACGTAPAAHVLFPAGATPTSVVIPPWDPTRLLVALWNRGEVVSVPANPSAVATLTDDNGLGYEVVYEGAANPQHLVVDGDRVLLTDHISGRIVALSQNPRR